MDIVSIRNAGCQLASQEQRNSFAVRLTAMASTSGSGVATPWLRECMVSMVESSDVVETIVTSPDASDTFWYIHQSVNASVDACVGPVGYLATYYNHIKHHFKHYVA
jgi:hypothetical protein